jgi:hypothetical protein
MFTQGPGFLKMAAATDPFFGSVRALLHFNNDYVDVKGNAVTNTGTTFSAPGKFGGFAVSINGTSPGGGGTNVVSLGASSAMDVTSGGNFTIECWGKLNNAVSTPYAAFLRLSLAGATEVTLGIDGPSGCVFAFNFIGSGNDTHISASSFPIGTFAHVALSRSGNNYYLLYNGTLAATWVQAYAFAAGSKLLQIGAVGGFALDGQVDDVRITAACRYTGAYTVPSSQFPDL